MGNALRLSDFRVLTFDCYGTLIDWEAGILGVLRPWAARVGVSVNDAGLLSAFAEAESAAELESPGALYPEILRSTHARIAGHFRAGADAASANALANSVGDWPAFADTREALDRLHRRYKLMVVSNVDRASFARTQKLRGVPFDAVVTAEEVGTYKPDPRMYRRALEVAATLGAAPQQVLHVAQSLYHDHVPAKALGLSTVWVRRPSHRGEFGATRDPGVAVQPDMTVHSLAEFADAADSQ
jgi:2-haloalkanoic acid dehalogenase type II